ncbi:hypothetical protein [Ralstonia pseudosolanacearum]|uniref:hypothetical protein n=1 Tax=Ralstonia pseudosolanacearum TaxID=1310165 RepID=UPI0033936A7D
MLTAQLWRGQHTISNRWSGIAKGGCTPLVESLQRVTLEVRHQSMEHAISRSAFVVLDGREEELQALYPAELMNAAAVARGRLASRRQ